MHSVSLIGKDHCIHSDYIDIMDYPKELLEIDKIKNIKCRLDIEDKAKNQAIIQFENSIFV